MKRIDLCTKLKIWYCTSFLHTLSQGESFFLSGEPWWISFRLVWDVKNRKLSFIEIITIISFRFNEWFSTALYRRRHRNDDSGALTPVVPKRYIHDWIISHAADHWSDACGMIHPMIAAVRRHPIKYFIFRFIEMLSPKTKYLQTKSTIYS